MNKGMDLIQILTVGGAILAWLLLVEKLVLYYKERSEEKIIFSTVFGEYSTTGEENSLQCSISCAIFNRTNKALSITDIIGTLRYNEERYQQNQRQIILLDPKVYTSKRPLNFREITPYNLPSLQSARFQIQFRFNNIIPEYLDRHSQAYFSGFLRGVQVYRIEQTEIISNWDNLPIIMKLTVLVNQKDQYHHLVPLRPQHSGDSFDQSGLLMTGDIEKIGLDFWEDRNEGVAFDGGIQRRQSH